MAFLPGWEAERDLATPACDEWTGLKKSELNRTQQMVVAPVLFQYDKTLKNMNFHPCNFSTNWCFLFVFFDTYMSLVLSCTMRSNNANSKQTQCKYFFWHFINHKMIKRNMKPIFYFNHKLKKFELNISGASDIDHNVLWTIEFPSIKYNE